MAEVRHLHAVGECFSTKEDLAQWLRDKADAVASGQWGDVDRMVLMLHSPGVGVETFAQGPDHFRTHAVIGMIECGKSLYMEDF